MKNHLNYYLNNNQGFALIESLVALVIISISVLALMTVFAGAAMLNQTTGNRQQAIFLANSEISKLKTLEYQEVALASNDPALAWTDWQTTYCPVIDTSDNKECSDNTRMIISDSISNNGSNNDISEDDPRKAKKVSKGDLEETSYFRNNGLVSYTYIYYPYDPEIGAVRTDWKVATVIVKYRDSNSSSGNTALVKLSTIIVDNPGLSQIPTN